MGDTKLPGTMVKFYRFLFFKESHIFCLATFPSRFRSALATAPAPPTHLTSRARAHSIYARRPEDLSFAFLSLHYSSCPISPPSLVVGTLPAHFFLFHSPRGPTANEADVFRSRKRGSKASHLTRHHPSRHLGLQSKWSCRL